MTMHPGMETVQGHGSLYSSPVPPPMHSPTMAPRPVGGQYGLPPLEYKIHDMNRRLRQRPEYADRYWWEHFAAEFFDDTATMLISFYTPTEGEKHFTIGRAMIPQYFSSIFEGGVTEMYYSVSFPREYMSHSGPTLECDSALTTTQYLQPSYARILVESKLSFLFTFDEAMRIRSWTQYLMRHKEYLPREMISVSLQESGSVDSLLPNITHFGINNCTLNFLNVSAISDSIRVDAKGRNYGMPPADCIQNNWSANHTDLSVPTCMMAQPISSQPLSQPMADFSQSPALSTHADSIHSAERLSLAKSPKPTKKPKRVRKGAASKESPIPLKKLTKSGPISMASPPPGPPMIQHQQDVMIVGEPILMGGELGEEDERRITRLENSNNSDLLAPGHLHLNPNGMNGGTDIASGYQLNLHNEAYDEPSITAALDALEQDAVSLSALP